MFRHLSILLLSSIATLLANWAQADTLNVHLLLSDRTPPYQQFSASLQRAVAASNADIIVVESIAGAPPPDREYDLIIAAGTDATRLAVTGPKEAPVLSTLIPANSYAELLEKYPMQSKAKKVSAIYLDQPWDRQLNFIRAVLPRHNVVGVLYSPNYPKKRSCPYTNQSQFRQAMALITL